MSLNTIDTAAREYARRPKDERHASLAAMLEAARHDKQLSRERGYNLKDLAARATNGDVLLESARGAASLSHWSFGQLARTVGAPAGYLRDGLSAELAAECINYGIKGTAAGTSVNVLVRGANGAPPLIRSITSESYGRVWDADLYGAVDQHFGTGRTGAKWSLPPTWDGEPAGAYRGDRDSFLIQVEGGSIVTDPSLRARAGSSVMGGSLNGGPADAMYRGIMVRNSEVGASSITIETVLYRYVCGNHMLWGATIDRAFRRRHVGTGALRATMREIGTIARKWADRPASEDEAIIRRLIALELANTREGCIDELRALGATAEQAASAYDTCAQTEAASPRSFWGLAQGLTRDSQQSEYQDVRYQLDRLAGLVLARGAKVAA